MRQLPRPAMRAAIRLSVAVATLLAACTGDGVGTPDPVAPGAPSGVAATAGDRQVTLAWAAPAANGGAPILRYRIASVPAAPEVTADFPATSATVPGLANGTAYTFTVTAVNAAGESAPSAPSAPVAPRPALPGAPQGVRASAGNGSATVTWTRPAAEAGVSVAGYRVTATPGGATVAADSLATSATVSGLANGTPYTFVVRALNAAGEGPPSPPTEAVTPRAAGGPVRWVTGYYMGYQQGLYPPSEVDFSLMTHVVVGRIVPTAEGGVTTTFDMGAATGPAMARLMSSRAHEAGRKALLMLGGAGTHAPFAAAIAEPRRGAFADSLLRVMDAYGYDGIDVDFEPIEEADKAPLLAFLQLLRSRRPQMLITLPVGWVNTNFTARFDGWYAQAAAVVDQMNLMTYSMAGPWQGWQVWHHSALYDHAGLRPSSVASSIGQYRSAGVPAQKLGLGLGFYGSCWRNVHAPREAQNPGVTTGNSDRFMTYDTIMTRYHQPGARRWDDAAKVPYLTFAAPTGPQGCNYISYEDEESIAAKGEFARAQGLGGAIIWTIGQGHSSWAPADRRDPLLKAAHRAFLQP